MKTLLIYLAHWFGLMIVAVANGALRQYAFGKWLPELRAHQLSTAIGLSLIGLYTWVLTGMRPLTSPSQAVTVGALWFGMTVLFEFGFGHYVMKHPWRRLLHDYNLFAGRVWVLVLVGTAVLPYLCFAVRS